MTSAHYDADHPTPQQLYNARGWLLDCGFNDELVFDLTDSRIVGWVDHEYEGGWKAFAYDDTGHLLDRRMLTRPRSAAADALAQWTVMIAKAGALGVLTEDSDTSTRGGQR